MQRESNRKGAARQGKARQEQELMLLEREKDASALINVLLGNQNEFVAWRSQTDRAGRDRQTRRGAGAATIHLSHLKRAKREEGRGTPRSWVLWQSSELKQRRKESMFNAKCDTQQQLV